MKKFLSLFKRKPREPRIWMYDEDGNRIRYVPTDQPLSEMTEYQRAAAVIYEIEKNSTRPRLSRADRRALNLKKSWIHAIF